MSQSQIREVIAISGKCKVAEVVSYFKIKYPGVDLKQVRAEAKDLLKKS